MNVFFPRFSFRGGGTGTGMIRFTNSTLLFHYAIIMHSQSQGKITSQTQSRGADPGRTGSSGHHWTRRTEEGGSRRSCFLTQRVSSTFVSFVLLHFAVRVQGCLRRGFHVFDGNNAYMAGDAAILCCAVSPTQFVKPTQHKRHQTRCYPASPISLCTRTNGWSKGLEEAYYMI